MPAWPKSFYSLGVNFLTAATEWKLRRTRVAGPLQKLAFESLTTHLARTAYWREAGVVAGMGYDSFQARLAPRRYADLAPAIERMQHGEADVLWPGRCSFFALTAGTTGPSPKCIPVTDAMLEHFRQAGLDALLYYTVRVRHAAVARGRHLFLSASTAVTPLPEAKPHEAYVGDLSGITALNLPDWCERHLYEPGAAVAAMSDWSAKLDAIVRRTRSLDITLLAGQPNWTLLLATALRESSAVGKSRITNLQGLWPNLECFVHGGIPLGPYRDELRQALGPTVKFHEVYTASEGFIAAQDTEAGLGLRLMAGAGIFYEFIPLADFDEDHLDRLGRKAVPLVDVATGVDYVVLLTTPGGLARYVVGDIVRFTSTEPPRLIYVGRTEHTLNTFGERLTEKEMTDALVTVCARQDWHIVHFHVAPLSTHSLTGQTRGRHEWWLELRPGTKSTPIGHQLATELDLELQKKNPAYEAKRKAAILELPAVRLVMPGVFEHWQRWREKWGGQHKLPRSRHDRLVADELAQITSFTRD